MHRKNWLVLLALGMVGLLAIASCGRGKVNESEVRAYADPIVENILQAINNDDYTQFGADLDQQMKEAIPESSFHGLSTTLKERIGDYVSKEFVGIEVRDPYKVVSYRAKYTNEPADVTVTASFENVDGKNLVAGLFLTSPKLQGQ